MRQRGISKSPCAAGLIEVLDLNTASYYDLETMDCVFETYLGYEAD